MSVTTKLLDVYCDNFVAYYTFHAMHINVTGRNFESDHKLLGKIYEDAQSQIDTIGEMLRTIKLRVPTTFSEILETASISEENTEFLSADQMLELALDLTEKLISCYREVISECDDDTECAHISNFAQDRVLAHEKFAWKLRSTLE
jgi:starvation-inducible DNA-binding protein